jgi:RNA polymerase sigma factor (sigma-70 family)
MEGSASAGYLRDMQTLFDAGTASGLSDRQLLERFAGGRDSASETAFAVLIERHGPMVMRVCRSTVGHEHADVHDAFQATFLVLVRKSQSIRRLDSVGSWLFGVASRVARRARAQAARRRLAERAGGLRIAATADHGPSGAGRGDLGELLQAEVERLPDHLRAVVVLCYWEGLTHEQAAGRLGCPLGTVRSRVARARDRLHRRLSRCRPGPVAGVINAAFDSPDFLKATAVEIPATLVTTTAHLAKQLAAGGSLAQLTSPSISALVQKVIGSMSMTKLRTTAICLLLIGGGVYGLTLAAQRIEGIKQGRRDRAQPPTAAKARAQPPVKLMSEYVVEPPDLLLVEVLEALPGRDISGERLVRPDGAISLGFYGDIHVAGLTLPQVKEKIILHLRKYLPDETLGLVVQDDADEGPSPPPDGPENSIPRAPFEGPAAAATKRENVPRPELPLPRPRSDVTPFDDDSVPGMTKREDVPAPPKSPESQPGVEVSPFGVDSAPTTPKREDVPAPPMFEPAKFRRIEPRDSDRVFVDVTAYNSKIYYVQGEFVTPGRLPVTGQERILDAVNYANGLTAEADHDRVFLYRQRPDGGPVQTLKVDIDEIMLGDDLSTNYQLLAGDKLVARRREDNDRGKQEAKPRRSTYTPKPVGEAVHLNRGPEVADEPAERAPEPRDGTNENRAVQHLEKRIGELERKLDVILETLKRPVR